MKKRKKLRLRKEVKEKLQIAGVIIAGLLIQIVLLNILAGMTENAIEQCVNAGNSLTYCETELTK